MDITPIMLLLILIASSYASPRETQSQLTIEQDQLIAGQQHLASQCMRNIDPVYANVENSINMIIQRCKDTFNRTTRRFSFTINSTNPYMHAAQHGTQSQSTTSLYIDRYSEKLSRLNQRFIDCTGIQSQDTNPHRFMQYVSQQQGPIHTEHYLMQAHIEYFSMRRDIYIGFATAIANSIKTTEIFQIREHNPYFCQHQTLQHLCVEQPEAISNPGVYVVGSSITIAW